ncbi:MAG: hypothetical protein K0M50_20350 [Prolixibacteraceae bacterium]|nr:hypothetical protein [Prolixibacteraceae bacterium]
MDICAICGKKTEQRDGMMSMEKWKTEVRRKNLWVSVPSVVNKPEQRDPSVNE